MTQQPKEKSGVSISQHAHPAFCHEYRVMNSEGSDWVYLTEPELRDLYAKLGEVLYTPRPCSVCDSIQGHVWNCTLNSGGGL